MRVEPSSAVLQIVPDDVRRLARAGDLVRVRVRVRVRGEGEGEGEGEGSGEGFG